MWSHYYSRVIHSSTCKAYKMLALPNDYVSNPFKSYKENILKVTLQYSTAWYFKGARGRVKIFIQYQFDEIQSSRSIPPVIVMDDQLIVEEAGNNVGSQYWMSQYKSDFEFALPAGLSQAGGANNHGIVNAYG